MLTLIITFAVLGYLAVIFEVPLKINKTITAIFTGSVCWIIYALYNSSDVQHLTELITTNFGEIAGLLIFLLGAMTIVELIDLHKGFSVIVHRIRTESVLKLLWIIGLLAFFLSSILDNLATTIIMVTILNKLLPRGETRMILAGIVVIAANAGGAFSPIGDITTTLLWIGGQVSAEGIISNLFTPSLFNVLIPLILASYKMRGSSNLRSQISMERAVQEEKERGSLLILITGVLALLSVPVIKTITGLPPFIGVLFGLAIVASVSEIIHFKKTPEQKRIYSVSYALTKVDISAIFYFMGILLMVFVLEEVEILASLADLLLVVLGGSTDLMVILIGIISSIVDNGSLVAATQGMFSIIDYPMDHKLWEFLALTAGTGGSLLVIGSASGIAVMEKEGITFMWYLKKIMPLALAGYLAGIAVYVLQYSLLH